MKYKNTQKNIKAIDSEHSKFISCHNSLMKEYSDYYDKAVAAGLKPEIAQIMFQSQQYAHAEMLSFCKKLEGAISDT